MKKQVSVRLDERLNNELEQRVKELGISKSAFLSFSAQFFLHQLNHAESSSASKQVNMYEMIKTNLENQYKND
ncbi:hypothetical protein [Halobacillus litoralis]|uniref:Uncharacterized protein n=1 Tax=Halobacillus litoralis TaxID=45668 RepID=A0A410MFJ9_9BACI|nr:hypothetical protein [Halobacillus litoralis]QAS53426.1 hypothetical protein HLI_15080 [Halobacillus litoralis]